MGNIRYQRTAHRITSAVNCRPLKPSPRSIGPAAPYPTGGHIPGIPPPAKFATEPFLAPISSICTTASQGASGYEPLRRDRRARLDALQTGDGRRLPQHLKAQVCRELDRLELLLEQIKAVEAERDAPLDAEQTKAAAPPLMLLGVRGIGPEIA